MTEAIHIDIAGLKQLYQRLREKEGRIYSDEQVMKLPTISKSHAYFHEWQMRKRSSKRLIQYLHQKKYPLSILEIGCGNGWLCHQLAHVSGSQVTGADINQPELQQATRVFSHIPNLKFVYGNMASDTFDDMQFDIVVMAACIQYFPSLQEMIRHSMKRLKPKGEIHIFDSPLYKPGEAEAARDRTIAYYKELGFPDMANHYYHHTITDLVDFDCTMLYRPSSLQHYLLQYKNPFPWVRIMKQP